MSNTQKIIIVNTEILKSQWTERINALTNPISNNNILINEETKNDGTLMNDETMNSVD